MRFRLILLDLDGTLVDSAPGLHAAAVQVASRLGITMPPPVFVRDAIGRGTDRLIHRIVSGTMDGEVDRAIHVRARAMFDEAYASTCLTGTEVRQGVRASLEELRREGRRLVVATNKPRVPASAVLRHLDLEGSVDDLVSPEDARVVKPDPGFVHHVIRASGPDFTIRGSLLVGDSSIDAATATAAGIPFIAIRGGYDEGRDIADHVPTPDQVLEYPGQLAAAVRGLEAGDVIDGGS